MLVLLAGLAAAAWDRNKLTSLYQNTYMGMMWAADNSDYRTDTLYYQIARRLCGLKHCDEAQKKMFCNTGCGNDLYAPPHHAWDFKARVNLAPTFDSANPPADYSYIPQGKEPYDGMCDGTYPDNDYYMTLYTWLSDFNAISAVNSGGVPTAHAGECLGGSNGYDLFYCACPIATIDKIYSINGEVDRSHLVLDTSMDLEFKNINTGDFWDSTGSGLLMGQLIRIKLVEATPSGTCKNSPAIPIPGTYKELTRTRSGFSGCTITLASEDVSDGTQMRVCYKVYHVSTSTNGTQSGQLSTWSSWRPMGGNRGATPLSWSPIYGVFINDITTGRTVPYIRERTHMLLTPWFTGGTHSGDEVTSLQYSLLYDYVSGTDRKTWTWSIRNGTVTSSVLWNEYALASNSLTLSGVPSGADYVYFDDYPTTYWESYYPDCEQIDPSFNMSGCSMNVSYASVNGDVRYDFINDACQTQPWSPTYDTNITNMNAIINGTEFGYRGERIEFQVYVDCSGAGCGTTGGLHVEFWSSYPRGLKSIETFPNAALDASPVCDHTALDHCECDYPNPEKFIGCTIDLTQFVPDVWWNRPAWGLLRADEQILSRWKRQHWHRLLCHRRPNHDIRPSRTEYVNVRRTDVVSSGYLRESIVDV